MNKIAFLFDLDGVLIDSEKEYTRIWEEIDKHFPTGVENFPLLIKGQTLNKILTDHYSENIRPQVSDLLHLLEKQMVYSYCPGAREFLETLKSRGHSIAVVTSSDEVKMSHLYEDVKDFEEKINLLIDATKVERSKPDPQGYLLAAQGLNADIRNCVVFEDSVQGVKAGRASGAYVIGITGTKTREELSPHSDIVVESLAEIDLNGLETILKTR